MKYGSVCSGIEAATVAWHPLGWQAQWFSEIEQFPCAVLAHHYPHVPNLGDMTKIHESEVFNGKPIDLLVGGTPCQSFSVAGLRKGLDDPRGNLALVFLAIANRTRPRWVVWENVPGVLSSNERRDFGSFIGALGELGYGWAYRILDAQYLGVPQRRRRVFVVGHLGDWRAATAVLFERQSLSGDSAPCRKAGKGITPCAEASTGEISHCLNAGGMGRQDYETETIIFEPRSQDGVPRIHEGNSPTLNTMGGGQRQPCVAFGKAVHTTGHQGDRIVGDGDVHPALSAEGGNNGGPSGALVVSKPVVFMGGQGSKAGSVAPSELVSPTIRGTASGSNQIPSLATSMQVRRLTPRECERLQGFPDDYTLIPYRGKPASDGPRYKAIGNSMAVPVMRWIGNRIDQVDAILKTL